MVHVYHALIVILTTEVFPIDRDRNNSVIQRQRDRDYIVIPKPVFAESKGAGILFPHH